MFPSQKRLFPRVLGTLLFNNDNGLGMFSAFVPNVPKIFGRYPEQIHAPAPWSGGPVMRQWHTTGGCRIVFSALHQDRTPLSARKMREKRQGGDWPRSTQRVGGAANFYSLRPETERPVLFLHAQVSVGGVPALGHYFPWERGNTSFLHQAKCFRGLILLAFMLPSYLGTNWEHYGNKVGTNTNIFIT